MKFTVPEGFLHAIGFYKIRSKLVNQSDLNIKRSQIKKKKEKRKKQCSVYSSNQRIWYQSICQNEIILISLSAYELWGHESNALLIALPFPTNFPLNYVIAPSDYFSTKFFLHFCIYNTKLRTYTLRIRTYSYKCDRNYVYIFVYTNSFFFI